MTKKEFEELLRGDLDSFNAELWAAISNPIDVTTQMRLERRWEICKSFLQKIAEIPEEKIGENAALYSVAVSIYA